MGKFFVDMSVMWYANLFARYSDQLDAVRELSRDFGEEVDVLPARVDLKPLDGSIAILSTCEFSAYNMTLTVIPEDARVTVHSDLKSHSTLMARYIKLEKKTQMNRGKDVVIIDMQDPTPVFLDESFYNGEEITIVCAIRSTAGTLRGLFDYTLHDLTHFGPELFPRGYDVEAMFELEQRLYKGEKDKVVWLGIHHRPKRPNSCEFDDFVIETGVFSN